MNYIIIDAGISEVLTYNSFNPITSGAKRKRCWGIWVKIKDTKKESLSFIYNVVLSGGEDKETIFGLFTADDINPHERKQVEPNLRDLIEDLLIGLGEDGKFVPIFSHENLLSSVRSDKFIKHVHERFFLDSLKNHDINNRLSYEQALLVLQEFYIVEPIMVD